MLTQVLSQVEFSKPADTEHSSFKGVKCKDEGMLYIEIAKSELFYKIKYEANLEMLNTERGHG